MTIPYKISVKKIIAALLITAAIIIGLLLIYRVSYYVAPFIIAFIVSLLIDPAVSLLVHKLKLKRSICSFIAIIIVLLIFGTILFLLILRMVAEIKAITAELPLHLKQLYTDMTALADQATEIYEWLPQDITANIGAMISNFSITLMNLANTVVTGAFTTIISIPEVLLFILVTIIATYFFTSDKERILGYFSRQLPQSWVTKISGIKGEMFSALFGYIKAQLILMSITFLELFIGFSIINVHYSLLLAFIISLIDALPILGTGSVLIPWAVYSALTGNIRMGISLIIIYAVVLIVRQMLEPKILGKQIGMHPLLTLTAMYAGLKILGIAGLIAGPITALLLKNILKGIFKDRTLKDIFERV